jgi:AbrB family looped-hinge helix DNA binding protein
METTLSSKGQVVLPQRARLKLGLGPGTKFTCKIANGAIVLTPRTPRIGKPKLIRDPSTGLTITKGAANGPTVTSEDVRAMLADFP